MRKRVVLEKEIGETPLEAIHKWKAAHPAYKDVPASYAGRLDPMASGKLLVLFGDECKKQKDYIGLDKEYEVEILFDIGSDTGDILGITAYSNKETHPKQEEIRSTFKREFGTHEREYPIFSSKTVFGKPLFLYALENSLGTISIPTHSETVYRITLLELNEISRSGLGQRIAAALSNTPHSDEPSKALGADFRIDAVRAGWDAILQNSSARSFTIATVSVTCGSGAYMRMLAARIGASLGTSALALSIHRKKIGHYFPLFRLFRGVQ